MSRWKAAGIHLGISAVIAVLAGLLIFGVWYPPPFSKAAGAPELVTLLLGVDLVLGPLLTLVVFKAGKKTLKSDLAVIALLQLSALVYGLSVVARARPAFIVAAVDQLVLVSANDLDPKDLAEAKVPEYQSVPWTGPKQVAAVPPTDPKEKNELLFSGIAGKDIEKYPKYYAPYEVHSKALLGRAKPIQQIKLPSEHQIILDQWMTQHHRNLEDTALLPLKTRKRWLTVVLDASDARFLDVLDMEIE